MNDNARHIALTLFSLDQFERSTAVQTETKCLSRSNLISTRSGRRFQGQQECSLLLCKSRYFSQIFRKKSYQRFSQAPFALNMNISLTFWNAYSRLLFFVYLLDCVHRVGQFFRSFKMGSEILLSTSCNIRVLPKVVSKYSAETATM